MPPDVLKNVVRPLYGKLKRFKLRMTLMNATRIDPDQTDCTRCHVTPLGSRISSRRHRYAPKLGIEVRPEDLIADFGIVGVRFSLPAGTEATGPRRRLIDIKQRRSAMRYQ